MGTFATKLSALKSAIEGSNSHVEIKNSTNKNAPGTKTNKGYTLEYSPRIDNTISGGGALMEYHFKLTCTYTTPDETIKATAMDTWLTLLIAIKSADGFNGFIPGSETAMMPVNNDYNVSEISIEFIFGIQGA